MGELCNNNSFVIEKDFEDSGHWEITLKSSWTAGDAEAIANEQIRFNMELDKENKEAVVKDAAFRSGKLATANRIILKWNATVNSEPVQVTPKNISNLPADVLDWIIKEWEVKTTKKASPPTSPSE